jgi:NAD+ synthase (glutamine-hydrolysing)
MLTSLIPSLGYVRIACISPRVRVGDPHANSVEIIAALDAAIHDGVDLAVFPELCLTGYTCADLFRQPDLHREALAALERVRAWTEGRSIITVVGLPLVVDTMLYNVAAFVHNGHIIGVVPKTYLPNAGEFYDQRWFASGANARSEYVRLDDDDVPFGTDVLIRVANDPRIMIGAEICEDLWAVEPPSGAMAIAGATIIVNLSASNELIGKSAYRQALVTSQSARTYTAYAYASAGPTESTTDTVYSGHCIIAEAGETMASSPMLELAGTRVVADIDLDRIIADRANHPSFKQSTTNMTFRVVDIDIAERPTQSTILRRIDPHPFVPDDRADRNARCHEILSLQATGLAVRLERSRVTTSVIGVSGGLDSTLAMLVCERAHRLLGRPMSDIIAVIMPGMGTSERTLTNARALSKAVGATSREIPIEQAVLQHFSDIGHDPITHDVVFENAQARERTQILMDIANGTNGLVIGTGDLSEAALGWSTYNADHMSMYAVNMGVPKTLVQYVIEWYSNDRDDATLRQALADILATPISPELLPLHKNGEIVQQTEELVGPYALHDFFLYHLVRTHASVRKILVLASAAFEGRYSDAEIARWLGVFLRRFFTQQFKRSCVPDTVKVGTVALSPRADWRMPSDSSVSPWIEGLEDAMRDGGLT